MSMTEQTEILNLTAVELSSKIKAKEIAVKEAVEAVFSEVDKREKDLHCYITLDKEAALQQAEQIQAKINARELNGPLAGVPAAVKDNLCTADMRTTCASRMLDHFVPSYSSEAVLNLQRAGVVILGKTNMDEFAMGSTTETSAYGITRNPWNTEHVPGGSSGGSAAAVAAKECYFALGSDTGGSVRQPASYCGVVGMKPTYGTVSRYGLVAYASSFDQIGPIAGNVTDCAAILETITSHDKKDSTSIDRQSIHLSDAYGSAGRGNIDKGNTDGRTDFTSALIEDVNGIRIGIPKSFFTEGLNNEVKETVLAVAEKLRQAGAVVEEFDLTCAGQGDIRDIYTEYAVPAYYTIACAEASSNLERFDGIKYGYRTADYDGLHSLYKKTRSEGFGAEVKRRIMLGSFVLSSGYYDAYYLKALKTKALIKRAFDEAFTRYDIILGPTAPTTAPKLGESLTEPLKMYLSDIYTIGANLAGLPAISVPCGTDSKGLPIGMQLMADCFQEKTLIQAAYTYEQLRSSIR